MLRVAILLGARAIGGGTELGSIETDKYADLVVLDANPLDDIRNTNTISMVMKNGRLYDGNRRGGQRGTALSGGAADHVRSRHRSVSVPHN